MAFDPMPASGSGGNEPWCTSCKAPIAQGEKIVRIHFDHDPHGHEGLSGEYHEACSKPFASIAHALKTMNIFGRF